MASKKKALGKSIKQLTTASNPLDVQVGGDHYKSLKIQPVEFVFHNNIGFLEGSIIKYASRHLRKDGPKDLEKVIHFAELALKLHYPEYKREQKA